MSDWSCSWCGQQVDATGVFDGSELTCWGCKLPSVAVEASQTWNLERVKAVDEELELEHGWAATIVWLPSHGDVAVLALESPTGRFERARLDVGKRNLIDRPEGLPAFSQHKLDELSAWVDKCRSN